MFSSNPASEFSLLIVLNPENVKEYNSKNLPESLLIYKEELTLFNCKDEKRDHHYSVGFMHNMYIHKDDVELIVNDVFVRHRLNDTFNYSVVDAFGEFDTEFHFPQLFCSCRLNSNEPRVFNSEDDYVPIFQALFEYHGPVIEYDVLSPIKTACSSFSDESYADGIYLGVDYENYTYFHVSMIKYDVFKVCHLELNDRLWCYEHNHYGVEDVDRIYRNCLGITDDDIYLKADDASKYFSYKGCPIEKLQHFFKLPLIKINHEEPIDNFELCDYHGYGCNKIDMIGLLSALKGISIEKEKADYAAWLIAEEIQPHYSDDDDPQYWPDIDEYYGDDTQHSEDEYSIIYQSDSDDYSHDYSDDSHEYSDDDDSSNDYSDDDYSDDDDYSEIESPKQQPVTVDQISNIRDYRRDAFDNSFMHVIYIHKDDVDELNSEMERIFYIRHCIEFKECISCIQNLHIDSIGPFDSKYERDRIFCSCNQLDNHVREFTSPYDYVSLFGSIFNYYSPIEEFDLSDPWHENGNYVYIYVNRFKYKFLQVKYEIVTDDEKYFNCRYLNLTTMHQHYFIARSIQELIDMAKKYDHNIGRKDELAKIELYHEMMISHGSSQDETTTLF